MALQNTQQSKDMNLVLSSDAKPRLKWTPDLHQRFVDAVSQLGGPDSKYYIGRILQKCHCTCVRGSDTGATYSCYKFLYCYLIDNV